MRRLSIPLAFALTACPAKKEAPPVQNASAPAKPMAAPAAKPAAAPAAPAAGNRHDAFDMILKKTVANERVDYAAIKANHAADLTAYLDRMAQVDPAALPEKERLAFFINVYNATMIQAVLDRNKDGWSPAADDYAVFKADLVRLQSGKVSLNHLENEIVRKQFKEPRIHVALVCGARSCPPLIARAYRAGDLDAVLEANMKAFVTSGTRNMVDDGAKPLKLSKIFDWYKDDFGGDTGRLAYIDKYTASDTSGYTAMFQDYDWTLNAP